MYIFRRSISTSLFNCQRVRPQDRVGKLQSLSTPISLIPPAQTAPPAIATPSKNQDVQSTVRVIDEDPNASWFVTGDARSEEKLLLDIHRKDLQQDEDKPLWLRVSQEGRLHEDQNNDRQLLRNKDGSLNIAEIVRYLEEIKAEDVRVIDVRDRCSWTDHMVICSGSTTQAIKRYSEAFYIMAKRNTRVSPEKEGDSTHLNKGFEAGRLVIEGKEDKDWKLVDLGSSVIHFFTREARPIYDLDGIWGRALGENYPELPNTPAYLERSDTVFQGEANK